MKRNLITILSLVVTSLLLNATGAYAQSYAKAEVPFAFNVGAKQLPAGTYEIRVLGQSPSEIMIRNTETNSAALSIARTESPRNTESKLVFDRIGTQYFLTEVWKGLGAGGMIVPTSKHEQELKKELQLAKGSADGNEQVIVALK
ncbi:MAG: hypothetical protein WBQ10_17915 [Terriglobales bacterium]